MKAPLATEFDLIRVVCPCGRRHRLTPRSAGKQFRCRKCGAMLTVPGGKEPSPPPRRRPLVWIVAVVIGTVIINAASLRRNVEPRAQVKEQAAPPVVIAAAEPTPEAEHQAPAPVAIPVAEPSPAIEEKAPPAPPVAIPDGSPEFRSQFQLASAGDADAMKNVGNCYFDGNGVGQDHAKAVEWYKRAAEAGNHNAMYNLGQCYEEGTGVAQSAEESAAWYEEAAKAGNRDAMYTIATLYERGEGVDQDYQQAAEWYEKAAEAGDAVAMHNIGLCYAVGKGVQADRTLAAQWLSKSAGAGYESAKPLLGLVMVGIPPLMATAMMAKPIGGKYAETHETAPPPGAANEDSPPRESAGERVEGQLQRMNRLLGGHSSSTDARLRQRYVQGFLMQQRQALHHPNRPR